MGNQKRSFSRWNIITVVAFAVVCFTSFQPVLQATIVHPSIAGNIFDITGYVASLSELYSPWLPLMLSPGSGERTATLLVAGTWVLRGLCVVAVAAVLLEAASIAVNAVGRRKPARVLGYVGFALALLVPLATVVVCVAVQTEMSSQLIAIDVLGVRPVCYVQLVAAVAGLLGVRLSTRCVGGPCTTAA